MHPLSDEEICKGPQLDTNGRSIAILAASNLCSCYQIEPNIVTLLAIEQKHEDTNGNNLFFLLATSAMLLKMTISLVSSCHQIIIYNYVS